MKLILFLVLFVSSLANAQQGLSGAYLNLKPAALPTFCSQGSIRFNSGSSTLNVCTTNNNWSSAGGGTWGSITGTLSSQTDLQTALNAKLTNPLTTTGDLIYSSSGTTGSRLGIGSSSSVLTVSGGLPSWQALPTPLPTPVYPISLSNGGFGVNNGSTTAAFNSISPLSTGGDILYENASLLPVRLGIGSSSSVLSVSGGLPSWQPLPTPNPTPIYPISLTNGGTGVSAGSSTAAFNALSPMSTLGDLLYENSSLSAARLAGQTSATKEFLTQTGTGSVSAIPGWATIVAGDVPTTLNTTIESSLSTVGTITSGTWNATTIALNHGGTGVAAGSSTAAFNALSPMSTNGDIIYENSSLSPVRLGIGSSNNSLLVSGGIPAWGAVPLASSGAVSGILPLANGGTSINAGSTTALFSSLSPATAAGDLLYENSTDTGITRLGIGASNSVLTVSGGLPTWAAATGGFSDPMTSTGDMIYSSSNSPTPARLGIGSSGSILTVVGGVPAWAGAAALGATTYAQAYFGSASSWTSTSTTFADPTNSGGNSLTVRQSSNLTLTAAGSSLPGVTFTPSSSLAVFLVIAAVGLENTSNSFNTSAQLTDGSTVIAISPGQQAQVGSGTNAVTLSGIYAPNNTSADTVKVQLVTTAGTAGIAANPATGTVSIEWTVIQINPPPTGVVTLGGGGTGVAAGSSTAAFNALSPMSTLGDMIYENASLNPVRLGIAANGSVLGIVGGIPAWTNAEIATRYHGSTNSILASMSVISYNTSDFDTNSAYTSHAAANGFFTVPSTGYYHYNASLNVTDATLAAGNVAQMNVVYVLSGSSTIMSSTEVVGAAATAKPLQLTIADIYYMLAGATVYVEVSMQGTTPSITSSNFLNYFSIGLSH